MNSAKSTGPSQQPMANRPPVLDFEHLALTSIVINDEIAAAVSKTHLTATDCMIPPVVYKKNDSYHLIDGYRRCATLQHQGIAGCTCGILDHTPDEHDATLLRVSLNRGRTFTTQEKLHLIKTLAPYRSEPSYHETCSIISSDRNELSLLEKMSINSPVIIEAVCSGRIDLSTAAAIDELDPHDQKAVVELYTQFPFSRQTQKELSDWLPELAFREQCTIAEILATPALQEILNHPKLNAPQKIEKIRQNIYERRFPTIVKAKKVWESRAAALNPDTRAVSFKPSEAFEKNRLEMKITLTSAAQARSIFGRLNDIQTNSWDQLIYPAQLYGEF